MVTCMNGINQILVSLPLLSSICWELCFLQGQPPWLSPSPDSPPEHLGRCSRTACLVSFFGTISIFSWHRRRCHRAQLLPGNKHNTPIQAVYVDFRRSQPCLSLLRRFQFLSWYIWLFFRRYRGVVVSTAPLKQKGSLFTSWPGPLCGGFACFPRTWLGFLPVRQNITRAARSPKRRDTCCKYEACD